MLFQLKRNDDKQSLVYVLQNEDGTTPILTGASVQFVMGKKNKLIINSPAIIQSATDGVVAYDFQSTDTLVAGNYMAEFVVTYPNGERQTFPTRGYLNVNIEQNLDTSQTNILVDMIAERQGEFTAKLNSILTQVGNLSMSAMNEYTWIATEGQLIYIFPSSAKYESNSKWFEVYVGGILVDDSLIKQNIDGQFELLIESSLIKAGTKVYAKWTEPIVPIADSYQTVQIFQQDTVPENADVGALWLDESDDTYQGTVFENLNEQLAQKVNKSDLFIDIKDFGAKSINEADSFDCAPAINAAIAHAVTLDRPFELFIPAGTYRVYDELVFTSVRHPFTVRGTGWRSSEIRPSAFGASKKLFKIDSNTADNRVINSVRLFDFSISTANSSSDSYFRKFPIAIYMPFMTYFEIKGVNIGTIGNTGLYLNGAFNADVELVDIVSSGWQPLEKTVPSTALVSISSNTNTVTCNQSVFDVNDVGRTITINGYGASGSDACFASVITSYISPTQVTIDTTPTTGISNSNFTFDIVRGAITAGSNILTTNNRSLSDSTNAWDSTDIGRFIYIDGAGTNGQVLVTKITNVSGNTITLQDNAITTISDMRVWFTPQIVLADETYSTNTYKTNDIKFNRILIENYMGAAVLIDKGVNVYFTDFKVHGRTLSSQNNTAKSTTALIASNARNVIVDGAEWEKGHHGTDSGYVIMSGDNSRVMLDNITISSCTVGGYFADVRSDDSLSFINIGSIMADIDWRLTKGLVKLPDSSTRDRYHMVGISGYAQSTIADSERFAQMPSIHSAFRTSSILMADDTAISIDTPSFAGFLSLWTEVTEDNAQLYFRNNTSPSYRTIYAGTNVTIQSATVLTGTTGTDGKLTISPVNSRKLYIENRTGASLRVWYHIMS